MIHMVRAIITEEEEKKLKTFLTHHGQLSHILREAVRNFIQEEEEKRNVKRGKRGGNPLS